MATLRGDHDAPSRFLALDAVLDGILHERLEHEVRHEAMLCSGIDGRLHLEATLEAHLHDVEIPGEEIQFLLERNLRRRRALDIVAQQIAETRDHASHSTRI